MYGLVSTWHCLLYTRAISKAVLFEIYTSNTSLLKLGVCIRAGVVLINVQPFLC